MTFGGKFSFHHRLADIDEVDLRMGWKLQSVMYALSNVYEITSRVSCIIIITV